MVLVTHPHFDHDAVDRVRGEPTIVRGALQLEGTDFRIRGFAGRHARHYGTEFGQQNVIFTVEVAGVSFCHLGDNRAELPEDFLVAVGKVDVLVVPVDGNDHLLTPEEVDLVVDALDPRVILPVHYRIDGLTDAGAPLGGIEGWLAGQPNVRSIEAARVTLSQPELPASREVWTFDLSSTGP